jgi:hypothetical protein
MTTATVTRPAGLDYDGATVATSAGPAIVAVQRIRSDAFRLSVRYASSGFEVPYLCRSYPVEDRARRGARMLTTLFRQGWAVRDVLDMLAVFAGGAS